MNPTLELLLNRHSVRAYEEKEISAEYRAQIIAAAMRAPTAGNMMLYSIIEVSDQRIKDRLVVTCDNQPFIAEAPLILLFLADYQRWYDYFKISGVEEMCAERDLAMRKPKEGDLLLACCDALISAETAVIAAESLGIGSCYIGDIMENCEKHREIFQLPQYTFPVALVCFGYPTRQQRERALLPRFGEKYIVYENRYRRLGANEFERMFRERHERVFSKRKEIEGTRNIGQRQYLRKFDADFTRELNRSVRKMIRDWTEE